MSTNAPVEHLQDALTLSGDAVIDLWEVTLKSDPPLVYRFWNGKTTTWQTQSYEGLPCQLSGEEKTSDGSSPRPQFTVYNPAKIFGVFAAEGYFDLAEIVRKRVLQTHLVNDVNLYEQRIWIVGRVARNMTGTLQLELRSPTDMPAWKTPRRSFNPPTYPFVTI